jgi:hypothetical protein
MSEIPVPKQYEHRFNRPKRQSEGQAAWPQLRNPVHGEPEKGDSKVIIQAMTEVGAFFLDKASRLYEQRPMRFSSSCSHNMAPSIFSVSFELTG